MEQIQYYIGIIAVIVIGIFIIKKVASCLIRTVVIFLLLGALLLLCTLLGGCSPTETLPSYLNTLRKAGGTGVENSIRWWVMGWVKQST